MDKFTSLLRTALAAALGHALANPDYKTQLASLVGIGLTYGWSWLEKEKTKLAK